MNKVLIKDIHSVCLVPLASRCLIVRHIGVYMSAAIKATVHLICCTVDGSQFSLRSKKREIADRAVPLVARKIISYSSILYFLS